MNINDDCMYKIMKYLPRPFIDYSLSRVCKSLYDLCGEKETSRDEFIIYLLREEIVDKWEIDVRVLRSEILLKAGNMKYIEISESTIYNAVEYGCLDVIKKIGINSDDINELLDICVFGGHTEVFRYLLEQVKIEEVDSVMVMQFIAESDNPQMVRILLDDDEVDWDRDDLVLAAGSGSINYLKYAYENGCRWYDDVAWCAMFGYGGEKPDGHLDCLKFVLENGCELGEIDDLYEKLAERGHVHIMEYLYGLGITNDCGNVACTMAAAEKNKLEALKWMCEHGFIYNELTFMAAVNNGSISCIKYLYSIGCPPCRNDGELASIFYDRDVFKRLILEYRRWLPKNAVIPEDKELIGKIVRCIILSDVQYPPQELILPIYVHSNGVITYISLHPDATERFVDI